MPRRHRKAPKPQIEEKKKKEEVKEGPQEKVGRVIIDEAQQD